MDIIKNCIEGIVEQQKAQASMYEKGFRDGERKGRNDVLKAIEESEQEMLNQMAKDFDVEKKGRYADKIN